VELIRKERGRIRYTDQSNRARRNGMGYWARWPHGHQALDGLRPGVQKESSRNQSYKWRQEEQAAFVIPHRQTHDQEYVCPPTTMGSIHPACQKWHQTSERVSSHE